MTATQTEILSKLIDQKHSLLEQLCVLGNKQLEMVHLGDMTALLELLAVKQRVMLRLQGVEAEFAPFRRKMPDQREWRSPADRQRCAERLQHCERLFEEIIAREQQSEKELVLRRDEVGSRLQGVHQASCARGAYAAQSSRNTGRIDLLSGK